MTLLPDRFSRIPSEPEQMRIHRVAKWFLKEETPTPEDVESFGAKLLEGDSLADALPKMYEELKPGVAREMLDKALDRGIESVDNPPDVLVALFKEVDAIPDWVDWTLIDHASTVFCRTGWASNLVLRNISLMGGYTISSINKPLVFTGALDSGVNRRIAETKSFWVDSTRPGGMRRDGAGFKTAVRVRVLHALLRVRIQNNPAWSNQKWGLPINQADLISTSLGFSSVYIIGMLLTGQQLSAKDRKAIWHFWRYIGYVMGIDIDYLPTDFKSAAITFYLMSHVMDGADDDSRAMALALYNEPLKAAKTPWQYIKAHIARAYHTAISNLFLSREINRSLKLPTSPLIFAPILVFPVVTGFEIVRRLLPPLNRFAIWWGTRMQARAMRMHLAGIAAAYQPVEKLTVEEK